MQQLMKDATVPASPVGTKVYSRIVNTERTQAFGVQLISIPLSNAASEAKGILQGSNNQQHWIDIATCVVTGADDSIKSDGGPFEAQWGYMRFSLEKTDNCKVDVFLSQREG